MGVRRTMKPSDIRWTQSSIKSSFISGKLIGETLDELCEGTCRLMDIRLIRVFESNGHWWSLDNRRLWVFKEFERLAGCVNIDVFIIKPTSDDLKKLTTETFGMTIRIRGGDPGGFWHSQPNFSLAKRRQERNKKNSTSSFKYQISTNTRPSTTGLPRAQVRKTSTPKSFESEYKDRILQNIHGSASLQTSRPSTVLDRNKYVSMSSSSLKPNRREVTEPAVPKSAHERTVRPCCVDNSHLRPDRTEPSRFRRTDPGTESSISSQTSSLANGSLANAHRTSWSTDTRRDSSPPSSDDSMITRPGAYRHIGSRTHSTSPIVRTREPNKLCCCIIC